MDGGFDLAVRNLLPGIEQNVQQGIKNAHHGVLPIGSAMSFSLDVNSSRHLVYAPTMRVPSNIQGTDNVYWAFRAALLEVKRLSHAYKMRATRAVRILTCPFGTASGGMTYASAAHQMRIALQHAGRTPEEIQFFQPWQAWQDHNELQMYKY
jgi:O-acetyl-ADP-ribose deacetylase (regulator of RNase III)